MESEKAAGPPQAPLPFWRWGWKSNSNVTRAYYVYRIAIRPLLVVAALLAAWLVVKDAVQQANGAVQWRDAEYRKLRSIHAGYELDFVQDVLGLPAQVNELGTTGLTERVFVRRDHFVQVVTSQAGRVLMYTVTSCDPDFQPTFDAEPHTEAQLQRQSLSDVPVLDPEIERERAGYGDGTHLFAENLRSLNYRTGVTGSTPENYWEWTGPSSNMSQLRSYFVGVNPLCLTDSQRASVPDRPYSGGVNGAPKEVLLFRDRVAANTYAETAPPLTPVISHLGRVLLPSQGYDSDCKKDESDCQAVAVGPSGFELPPSLIGQGSTRTLR